MTKAFCTSTKCSWDLAKYSYSKMVEKIVPKSKMTCPDCGHVLVWKKQNKRLHVAQTIRSKNNYL